MYKVTYFIFSCRKFDSPSLAVMRDWLEIFVSESQQDFFLNGSRQIENFQLLMKACRFPALSKTSRAKKWTSDFVADKLAILLVLRQQGIDEREERKRSGSVGHYAQARTKLRRTFAALHQKVRANRCMQRINALG
jgi:predicted alpha/beta hydrolase